MAARIYLAALLLVSGCANLMVDTVAQLRESNKHNLAQISVGMTRSKVETLMGTESAGGKVGDAFFGRLQHLVVQNPMREERHQGSDGATYDVLFYYTDAKGLDDKITDDELTPVVLRDDRVSGVGYDYLAARVPQYSRYR